jgi:perosamine synthetase
VGTSVSAPVLDGNEVAYVTDAVKTGWLTHHGSYEHKFEALFARIIGRPSLATSSGTGALHLALLASGIGRDDEVIVPALTFAATASVVLAVGAKPVLVDVDRIGCIDPEEIEDKITHRTRAIMPVHLYGNPCDMPSISGIAKECGLRVIEDSCEALGLVPSTADITCYSFYANKIITTGEGGMICGEFGKAEEWRNGGFDSDYYHELPGLNYRMTNLQAALGLAQLERIDELLLRRLKVVSYYRGNLKGFGRWLFCYQTPEPKKLAQYLKDCDVETRPIFYPLHLLPPFRQPGDYPNAEWVWKNHLCLPTGPHLKEEEQINVLDLIHSFQNERQHMA